MMREFNMKKIYIILSLILMVFSCEKENDDLITGENNQQRIVSKKVFINGILFSVDKYFYDENDKVISWNSTCFMSGVLPTPVKHTLEYKANEIIEYLEGYDPEINPFNKKVWEIENGHVTKISVYGWNGEEWDLAEEDSYMYNGSKLSSWNLFYTFASGTLITEGEIIYDGNLPTQRTRKNTYDNYFEMTGIAYRKEEFTYNDEQLQEVIIYRKYDDMVDWEIGDKIEYLRSGQEITKNTYYLVGEDTWSLDETMIYTFNEQGNITDTRISYAKGDYVREIVTEYENKPGNWEQIFKYPHENIDKIDMGN